MSVKQTNVEIPTELDEATLGLLGDDPFKDDQIGPDIRLAVAERWGRILRDGLPKEQRREFQEKYPTITDKEGYLPVSGPRSAGSRH